jgi:hypothetical protein
LRRLAIGAQVTNLPHTGMLQAPFLYG